MGWPSPQARLPLLSIKYAKDDMEQSKLIDLSPIQDCLWPSNNDLEIPTLDIDMQAQDVTIPFLCYGEQKRTFHMEGNGTLHFYTDDYRYSDIYNRPEKILQHNPRNIVEPNFSLFNEMPIAFGLQAIYKKRWIARAMQARGIRIFVDLNVAQKYYQMNMLGVPMGWRAFATRGYSDRLANLEFEYGIAKTWARDKSPLFVVYGGGKDSRDFCKRVGAVYINPVVTIKKKAEAIKKIAEGIAFFRDELELNEEGVNKEMTKLLSSQVEAFPKMITENKPKELK